MTILFGHPAGNPNSYHAALAHFEMGRLDSFCVPWMPAVQTLRAIKLVAPGSATRLERRHFAPLARAPKTQGRLGEIKRLLIRGIWGESNRLSAEANDWLMRTMSRECLRDRITAVHAYADCSLLQFQSAKRRGKACIYDMPIGHYAAWESILPKLAEKYASWLSTSFAAIPFQHEQRRQEMELADIVLAPSKFVADTIKDFDPTKVIALAPYGIDCVDLIETDHRVCCDILEFLFVGQCSVRKGTPLLLQAWQAAGIKRSRLRLVGPWQLAENKKRELPPGCAWIGPMSSSQLRFFYRDSDVFVFPTNFEGRALVIGEALASGLPVLTTTASGAEDDVGPSGMVIPPDDLDALVAGLRWFDSHRDLLPSMRHVALAQAKGCTWKRYRDCVSQAVDPYV